MPPQQPDRLLDLFNEGDDFGAHGIPFAAIVSFARTM
jgi:hypothetical protein